MKRIVPILVLVCAALIACNEADTGKAQEFVPPAPDYSDPTLWYTEAGDRDGNGCDVFYAVSTWEIDWRTGNGQLCHWADVWNAEHRAHMAIEIQRAAAYMADGNNFYAPYYRHTTIEAWATQDEDTVMRRTRLAMGDVIAAFDHFLANRPDKSRPIVLAGFSQGGMAVVELLKHLDDETARLLVAAYVLGYKVTPQDTLVCKTIRAARRADDVGVTVCYNTVKDVRYIVPIISAPCAMCINPVNWTTDSIPATICDTIAITCSPAHHVLVATNYAASEYPPILNFINVGDIHSCEPWLYSDCLRQNIKLRTQAWRGR